MGEGEAGAGQVPKGGGPYTLSANDAWLDILRDIRDRGSIVRSRGFSCQELVAWGSAVSMSTPLVTVARRKLGYRFAAAEAWWIISGRNDVRSIAPYSRHISSFSDNGRTFSGAYGPKIVDQLWYACEKLLEDHGTRQAVVDIWRPCPRDSRDIGCTLSLQWLVRDGLLHCVDTMRSSDTWLGWPYDVFSFSMLSAYLLLWLREAERRRGGSTYLFFDKVRLGSLYLTAGSQHLYLNPRQDGASNIPYSVKDVDAVLKDVSALEYVPLNLDEFDSPEDLLNHLGLVKDGKFSYREWMRELVTKEVVGLK